MGAGLGNAEAAPIDILFTGQYGNIRDHAHLQNGRERGAEPASGSPAREADALGVSAQAASRAYGGTGAGRPDEVPPYRGHDFRPGAATSGSDHRGGKGDAGGLSMKYLLDVNVLDGGIPGRGRMTKLPGAAKRGGRRAAFADQRDQKDERDPRSR